MRDKTVLKSLQDQSSKIEEIDQQMETPLSVRQSVPISDEGFDGDQVLVSDSSGSFVFIKVNGRWMKSQLEEVI
mgnify:FL=1|tara:strand:+ start:120 stop:341 length:222 start_codon:yes stop_codon:yes gene_type:complete